MPKMPSFPSGRLFVSCIRDFPKGCGPPAATANDRGPVESAVPPAPEPLPPPPPPPCGIEGLNSPSKKNPPPGILDVPLPVAEAGEKHPEDQVSEPGGSSESAGPKAEDPSAGGGAIAVGNSQLDNFEQNHVDSIVVVSDQLKQAMNTEGDAMGRGRIYSKLYPPPKRRAVSAIRQFPPGCGPRAKRSIGPKRNAVELIEVNEASEAHVLDGKKLVVVESVEVNEVGEAHVLENQKAKMETEEAGGLENDKAKTEAEEAGVLENLKAKIETKEASVLENLKAKMEAQEAGVLDNKKAKLESEEDGPLGNKKSKIGIAEAGVSEQNLNLGRERPIVQALMAAPNCPWRRGRKSGGTGSGSAVSKAKLTRDRKPPSKQLAPIEINDEEDSFSQNEQDNKSHPEMQGLDELSPVMHPVALRHRGRKRKSGTSGSTSAVSKAKVMRDWTSPGKHLSLIEYEDDENSFPQYEEDERDLLDVRESNELSVTIYPVAPSMHRSGIASKDGARHKVRRTLRLFQAICRKLLQGEEANSKDSKKSNSKGSKQRNRIDLMAAKILKDQGQWVNTGKPIIGEVPGVEVGDEFQFRAELSLVGLHRSFQAGIDRVLKNGVWVATSVVASGGYQDDMDSSDVLIYSGSGGMPAGKDKPPEDQKLEGGNLALKNSISAKTPVRVIHGFKESKLNPWSHDYKPKVVSTFTYAGLYLVEEYWQEKGPHGFLVYKYKLRRIPGQPELALQEVKRSKKSKEREGICIKDVSQGKEKIPICAINRIDNERPAPFKYVTKNRYPSWFAKTPPKGCDCTNGCSDSHNCACAIKNGGEIPFNFNGAIVQAKPLVYECGPSCKCPPSCHNRVSQRGIRIPLEIFKTKSRGWGVRSLYSIPSGSFVCEYIGELLKEKEAEQKSNDEYLFDIGHNYDDQSLWEGLPSLIPGLQSSSHCETVDDADKGFTIDAAEYGNVGRFINHSCSPNLYAQNLLYDHDDKRIPHIMFFAAENIPPLQELTYHYNYTVDQVRDAEGNIKRKDCHCGSDDCCGRLY